MSGSAAQESEPGAYAERWVRSVKEECHSKLILFGERSLKRTLHHYELHYHQERNQGQLAAPYFAQFTVESGAGEGAMARAAGRFAQILRARGRVNVRMDILTKRDVKTIIADTPEYSVLDKLDLTLHAIAEKTFEPGQRSQFSPLNDYPLVYAASDHEAGYYIQQLANLGYIRQESGVATILAQGFQRLQEMQKSGRASAFAFVAMWFAQQMNDVCSNAIEPAIRDAGYKPIRVDRIEHVNRIDDEIIGRIIASRFIVADFTGHRTGSLF